MNSFRDDLKAYLDGELPEARRAELEAALANDASLREEKEFFEMLNHSLRTHAAQVTTGDPATLIEKLRPSRPWWVRLAPFGAVAALALVAVLMRPVPSREMDAATGSVSYSESAGIAQIQNQPAEAPADIGGGGAANARARQPQLKRSQGIDSGLAGSPSIAPTLTPQLIRTGNLSLIVINVQESLNKAVKIAEATGGFSTTSSANAGEGELGTANATLRVPVKQFSATLDKLKTLGKVTSDTTSSEDVTAPIADMDARLRVLKAERESYIQMLRAANKVGEMLSIREQISNVTEEIESLTAQLKVMRSQASYSTINVDFTQKRQIDVPEPPKDWTGEQWTNAVNGLREVGRALGGAAIVAFVYAPLWLPVVILGAWFWRRSLRKP